MTTRKSDIRRILSKEDHEAASTIFTETFIKHNMLWKKDPPDYDEAYQAFHYKLSVSMGQEMAFGFYRDGKLIGTTCHLPMQYYLSLPKKTYKSRILNLQNHYSSLLEEEIPKHYDGKSKALYGTIVAMAAEHSLKGYAIDFWLEGLKMMQELEYKYQYGWTSSPVTRYICKKLGIVEELKEVKMVEEEVKGCWMVLLKFDLTKKLPELSEFKKSLINPSL